MAGVFAVAMLSGVVGNVGVVKLKQLHIWDI